MYEISGVVKKGYKDLSGTKVRAVRRNDNLIKEAVTDANGQFTFSLTEAEALSPELVTPLIINSQDIPFVSIPDSAYLYANDGSLFQLPNVGTIEFWVNISNRFQFDKRGGVSFARGYRFGYTRYGDPIPADLTALTTWDPIDAHGGIAYPEDPPYVSDWPNDGIWRHLAIRFEPTSPGSSFGTWSLVYSGSTTTSRPFEYHADSTEPFRLAINGIGRENLSDIRIWNYPRTDTEIQNDYQDRLIGNEPGLTGYWKCDQIVNGRLDDETANNNDLIISGQGVEILGSASRELYQWNVFVEHTDQSGVFATYSKPYVEAIKI